MILNKNCLKCGSTNELNTSMSVNIDNKKYDVVLCDAHAEDTTPKQAKDLVAQKISEYNDLVVKMRDFGVTINENNSGLLLAKKSEQQEEATKGSPQEKVEAPVQKRDIIKKVVLPNVSPKFLSTVPDAESHKPLNIQETIAAAAKKGGKDAVIPQTNEIETQVVAGRCGQPMVIPKVIRHNDGGDTHISVVNTGGDRTIQERTREISKLDRPHSFSKGYDVRECNICGGTGIARVGGNTCPKCRGAGLLNR